MFPLVVAVGVPENVPPLNESPADSVPDVILQVKGRVPPVVVRVVGVYAAPTSPSGIDVVVMLGAATMVSGSVCVALMLAESVTFTTSIGVAVAAGVPERSPTALSVRPPGRGGELVSRLHVYGGEPPVAKSDTPLGGLYTAVASPGGREAVVITSGGGEMTSVRAELGTVVMESLT
jgi:hypothetical protein